MGEIRKAYKFLVGQPEEQTPFGKPWRKWVYRANIKLRAKERVLEVADPVDMAQDRDRDGLF